jgi:hypothetical protein
VDPEGGDAAITARCEEEVDRGLLEHAGVDDFGRIVYRSRVYRGKLKPGRTAHATSDVYLALGPCPSALIYRLATGGSPGSCLRPIAGYVRDVSGFSVRVMCAP